jgi:phosphoribosylamine--glycine ligase
MKVLVIGSGSREHAFAWRLRRCPSVSSVIIAPGNPGTALEGENFPVKVEDIEGLLNLAKKEKVDLTLVGPEVPLALGVVDLFRSQGLRIFGPVKAAAALEGSKNFSKEVMVAAGVPTAHYKTLSTKAETVTHCDLVKAPIVLKSDGLAAGKGVCVCTEQDQILPAINFIFDELKADKVVVEEFLPGVEASYIVAAKGLKAVPMASSHDYKRLLDNQQGPNTGGMGSVSPTFNLTEEQERWVHANVIEPTLGELAKRGISYTGFLYAGLMISPSGKISVLEFNARMGDPECQSIMRRFAGDFGKFVWEMSDPDMSKPLPEATWSREQAVCIVASAFGYPNNVRKGDEITGLNLIENIPDTVVFHGGTEVNADGRLVTAGGRVLSVTATGADLSTARQKAYRGLDMIQFRGMHARRDVGK